MSDIYLALIHHPVYDKEHTVVTTSITNMDIHDISRSAKTYGVKRFFIVNPVPTLRALAEKILEHWQVGYGSTYNVTRKDALAIVSLIETLEETLQVVRDTAGEVPQIIATSAKDGGKRLSFPELRSRIAVPGPPFLLLLGTGWGLTEEVLDQADDFLEPIHGVGTYNHLSVRAAAAILLDRLLGAPSVN
jgi:hypothetical protein